MKPTTGLFVTGLFCLGALSACDGDINVNQSPNDDSPTKNNTTPPPKDNPRDKLKPFAPGHRVFPRLTQTQYHNIVRDTFGTNLPQIELEKDTNPFLFYNIGAATTVLTEYGAEQYEASAMAITRAIFESAPRRNALLGCNQPTPDDACITTYIDRIGRTLYRRPLQSAERDRWVNLAKTIAPNDIFLGLQMATAGMLQSPKFLYRIEQGQPTDDPNTKQLTSFEMAQRLAFLFWNSAPDDLLLQAAERGELLDEQSIRTHATRMLKDPRAREAVQSFFAQYLDLKRLNNIERDTTLYPGFSPQLVDAMRTEVKLLVDHVVFRQDEDIRALFSAKYTFVNRQLADWYQLDAPDATNYAFIKVDLPTDGPRAGLLTLGAFLTMNAHPTETSPTLRGKYIRERIFCQTVPDPPQDIDLNLEPMPGDNSTLRKRLEAHQNDPNCVGCHSFIDPPGYLFEGFDAAGRHRTMEGEHPIDSTGNLNGVALQDARGLSTLLREDTLMPSCLVKQLYRHANGRLDQDTEEIALYDLGQTFALSGYRFQTLLVELAISEGFRTISATEGGEQ